MNAIENRTNAREMNHHRLEPGPAMKLGIVTALVACAGCAVTPAGETTSASPPPIVAPIVAPLAAPNAATVSIEGIAQASDGSPIAGVAVCLRPYPTTSDHASCTTSDGSGAWSLAGAPSNALVAITFIKAGYVPTLRPIGTATSDLTIPAGDGALIASTDAARLIGAACGAPLALGAPGGMPCLINPAGGQVAFATATPGTRPTAAATVTLDAVGDPAVNPPQTTPVYFDADGEPRLGASSGTSGAFAGLTPGYYVMTFSGASVACRNSGGLYGLPVTAFTPDGQARMLLPVVEGFLTAPVAASCSAVGAGS